MISRLIPPLTSPVSGATSASTHKQKGIADFAAVLDAPPVVEVVQFGTGSRRPREQSVPSDAKASVLPTHALPAEEEHATQHQAPQATSVLNDPAVNPLLGVQIPVGAQQALSVDPMPLASVLRVRTEEISVRPRSVDPIRRTEVRPEPLVTMPSCSPQAPSAARALAVPMPARPAPVPAVDANEQPLLAPQGMMMASSAAQMPDNGALVQHAAMAVPVLQQEADSNAHPVLERAQTGAIGERIELVSMPWRLQANAGLSYRTITTDTLGDLARLRDDIPVVSQTTPFAHASEFTFASVIEGASIADWLDSLKPLTGSSKHDRSTGDAAPNAEVADSAQTETVASLMWPERLLRWLADSNGTGTTAWVRDYQLDPSQAERLIDALRLLAAQQGLTMDRIMLNGHELWRATPLPQITSRNP